MLNLRPIFDDAIHALGAYESFLAIPPLPATVFLMQRDVINHYHYAVTHYLPLTLSEHFLQKSSLGSPYTKWAKFTNDDFDMLSFAITNLLRYTNRLICETEAAGLEASRQFAECKSRSSNYISPLVEINRFGKHIGIRVHENQTLSITPFATDAEHEGTVKMTARAGGPTERFHITVDAAGTEHQRPITLEEWRQLTQTLRPRDLGLQDRSILDALATDGKLEVDSLIPLNRQFGELCNSYYSKRCVAAEFDNLNKSWCV